MLIGIHVAFAIAFHSSTCCGSVSAVTPDGGDIMYVSHELAMNMTIVPHTLSRRPSPQCPHFARPYFHLSQP